jgi:hypothetical protein
MTRFCVLLEVQTNDPRLTMERVQSANKSAKAISAVRAALLDVLPSDVERVVAIMDVREAKAAMRVWGQVKSEMGLDEFAKPPGDYVPPTRD